MAWVWFIIGFDDLLILLRYNWVGFFIFVLLEDGFIGLVLLVGGFRVVNLFQNES